MVSNGTNVSKPNNAFSVTYGGYCYAEKQFISNGADVAEYYETHDGKSLPIGTAVVHTGKITR